MMFDTGVDLEKSRNSGNEKTGSVTTADKPAGRWRTQIKRDEPFPGTCARPLVQAVTEKRSPLDIPIQNRPASPQKEGVGTAEV